MRYFDVVIVGAGPVGLNFAPALPALPCSHCTPNLTSRLIRSEYVTLGEKKMCRPGAESR